MNDKTPEELFLQIQEACAELGWLIAMDGADDGVITGIITGQGAFVSEIVEQLETSDNYEIYEHGSQESGGLH